MQDEARGRKERSLAARGRSALGKEREEFGITWTEYFGNGKRAVWQHVDGALLFERRHWCVSLRAPEWGVVDLNESGIVVRGALEMAHGSSGIYATSGISVLSMCLRSTQEAEYAQAQVERSCCKQTTFTSMPVQEALVSEGCSYHGNLGTCTDIRDDPL